MGETLDERGDLTHLRARLDERLAFQATSNAWFARCWALAIGLSMAAAFLLMGLAGRLGGPEAVGVAVLALLLGSGAMAAPPRMFKLAQGDEVEDELAERKALSGALAELAPDVHPRGEARLVLDLTPTTATIPIREVHGRRTRRRVRYKAWWRHAWATLTFPLPCGSVAEVRWVTTAKHQDRRGTSRQHHLRGRIRLASRVWRLNPPEGAFRARGLEAEAKLLGGTTWIVFAGRLTGPEAAVEALRSLFEVLRRRRVVG